MSSSNWRVGSVRALMRGSILNCHVDALQLGALTPGCDAFSGWGNGVAPATVRIDAPMAVLAKSLQIGSHSATPIADLLDVVELKNLLVRTTACAAAGLLALNIMAEPLFHSETPLSLEPV